MTCRRSNTKSSISSDLRVSRKLVAIHIEPSLSCQGNRYDDALAETIDGLYKAKLIHRRAPWKNHEAVELATLEWVSWFYTTTAC